MSEVSTKLKASPKLSAWIKAQIKAAAKYILDTAEPALVEIDRTQVKKTPLKSKAKTGKKR